MRKKVCIFQKIIHQMKKSLSVFLILSSIFCYAQKSPVKFGDIPMEDLRMKIYPLDSSAEAVVLVDYGKAYIQSRGDGYVLTHERHKRIKILKKEGLSWADFSVNLFHSGSTEETISKLKAVTYNLENGAISETPIGKESVFKEKFNRTINKMKFTLPGAKEGSVLEVSYIINSEFFTSFPNWKFQSTIPTRLSEYWAIIPEDLHYQRYMQGYVTTNYEVSNQMTAGINSSAHHWISKDIPAFKTEPFMTGEDDYISRINFALASYKVGGIEKEYMGSWEKLSSNLMESDNFGRVIDKSNFLKSKVEELVAGLTDPLEKIKVIHAYVRDNIEWDGEKDFTAGDMKKILEKKKGTSGDINLLLASMIDKAGLVADMLLISTRDHGFVRKQYPMERQFNYVLCLVRLNDKNVLLDATEKNLPYTVLPERCLNGEGLVISKLSKGWMEVTSKAKAKTIVSGEFILNESGELNGKLTYSRDGYDAFDMREKYKAKGEETYLKDFAGSKTWNIQKTEFSDIKELEKSVKEIHAVNIAEHASTAGELIYLNPFITSQISENPFKSDTRIYPVDFGSSVEKMYICKITMPQGYVIDELPPPKVIALPEKAGRYSYSLTQQGNFINVVSSLQINKSLFVQSEYPYLKEMYNQVIAKQAEQIVLKKK
jgi:hypothetical protein